jgi:hypothetical protein
MYRGAEIAQRSPTKISLAQARSSAALEPDGLPRTARARQHAIEGVRGKQMRVAMYGLGFAKGDKMNPRHNTRRP